MPYLIGAARHRVVGGEVATQGQGYRGSPGPGRVRGRPGPAMQGGHLICAVRCQAPTEPQDQGGARRVFWPLASPSAEVPF